MSNQLINVNLCGYLPRFGSGWREVEVLRETKKYVELRYAPRSCNADHPPLTVRRGKLPVDVWERLPKKKERTMTYVIQYTDPTQPRVVETVLPTDAIEGLPEDVPAFSVEDEADLKQLPTATLVALYNAAYPDAPVIKFESKAIGARRVFPILTGLVTKELEASASPPESAPTPPVEEPKNGGSPAKGKKLGIGKRMVELLTEGKTTQEVLDAIHAEYPQSRAKSSDVSVIRRKAGLAG